MKKPFKCSRCGWDHLPIHHTKFWKWWKKHKGSWILITPNYDDIESAAQEAFNAGYKAGLNKKATP